MNQKQAREEFYSGNRYPRIIFQAGCKGINFMTPNVLSYGSLNQWGAFEYSTGQGLDPSTTMHGISVVIIQDGEPQHCHQLGEVFYSKAESFEYVEELREYNQVPDLS